jgi:hypothetical protein
MYQYTIKFLALSDSITFEIKSEVELLVAKFVQDILFVFAEVEQNEKIVLDLLQKNSPEVRRKIESFNDKYKNKLPQLNKVPAFFRKLKEGEQFFFLPDLGKTIDTIKLYDFLRAVDEGKTFDEISGQTAEIFDDLLKKYQIRVLGDKRISIGEPIKSKRVCRFCNNKKPKITFNNKAHAISEGLGNKTIVLYDECDSCNTGFSRTIEPDIIQ